MTPDDCRPSPNIVESLAAGANSVALLQQATGRSKHSIKYQLRVLLKAGAVASTGLRQHLPAHYKLIVSMDTAKRILAPGKASATALLDHWPMPVRFPPDRCHPPRRHEVGQ